jgi:hypothetical protein
MFFYFNEGFNLIGHLLKENIEPWDASKIN